MDFKIFFDSGLIMGQHTELFLDHQNRMLLYDFQNTINCFVALSNEKMAYVRHLEDWEIKKLPHFRITNAIVIIKSAKRAPECWVRWNFKGYRKAFSRFLKIYYSHFEDVLDESVQVDHLEPRYRFDQEPDYFVRLHLVRKKVNAAFGSGYERSFYQHERKKDLPGAIRMSWLTFCKAIGVCPPGKNAGKFAWETWARKQALKFCKETDEPVHLAYIGFLSVLQLGYTGYYAGETRPHNIVHLTPSFVSI